MRLTFFRLGGKFLCSPRAFFCFYTSLDIYLPVVLLIVCRHKVIFLLYYGVKKWRNYDGNL